LELSPGTIVAHHYRISRRLGRGGAFAAESIPSGRPVVIELLARNALRESEDLLRFLQRARAVQGIESEHVVKLLGVEDDPQLGAALIFELLEGESLLDRLERTGPIPFDELWPIIEQVWVGLADVHRAGIVHCDLNSSNLFLEQRADGPPRVKLLGFGLEKVPEKATDKMREAPPLGTFSFMPPEQIGKATTVDPRADIYACATLVYQSLTGQLPYPARNILVMVEMKTKIDARKLGDAMAGPVDPRLEELVARGLARDPGKRFPTAVDALSAWRALRPSPRLPER
jgi:eukaryotic-like serine/threonine-protein kinase